MDPPCSILHNKHFVLLSLHLYQHLIKESRLVLSLGILWLDLLVVVQPLFFGQHDIKVLVLPLLLSLNRLHTVCSLGRSDLELGVQQDVILAAQGLLHCAEQANEW